MVRDLESRSWPEIKTIGIKTILHGIGTRGLEALFQRGGTGSRAPKMLQKQIPKQTKPL